jgi:hypothetical protein
LLANVEELMQEMDSKVFWRCSKAVFPTILAQQCSNKHERFLVVEEHGGGRRRGHILVLEGRNREDWRTFVVELRSVVKFFHSIFVDRTLWGVGKNQAMLWFLAKVPERLKFNR